MRILLLIITILCCIGAHGQLRIGMQGGYNHAVITPRHSSSEFNSYTTSGFRGFQAGAVAEVRLTPSWVLRPGLLISGKGTRLRATNWHDTSSRAIELHYLEIPLTLVHQWKAGKKSLIFAGAGMFAARAVRGVERGQGTSLLGGPYYIDNYVEFRSDNKENDGHPTIVTPFDYGYTLVAGLEHKGIQLLLGYEQGLQSVFPKSLIFDDRHTNRVLSISAAYLINTRK